MKHVPRVTHRGSIQCGQHTFWSFRLRADTLCCSQYRQITHTHTHTQVLRLSGFCLGQPGWASTRRNIHPLTPIMVISQSSLICFLHLIQSMASSLFNLRAWQSFSTSTFQVFFGLPLCLAPSNSCFIHFFTQSLSSFCSTCPFHCNLFCCGTNYRNYVI